MVDNLLGQLGNQGGILGIMLALTITALFTVVKLLLTEKDKRIEDAKQVQDSIASPLIHIKDSLDLIQQKVRISKKAERDDF